MGKASGQTEYIDNVIETGKEHTHANDEVAAEQIVAQVGERLNHNSPTAQKVANEVKANEDDSRQGIAPHAPPLQIARHGDGKRIDTLEIGNDKQSDEHGRMEHARMSLLGGGVWREDEGGKSKNAHNPRHGQILHLMTRQEGHDDTQHEMNHAATKDDVEIYQMRIHEDKVRQKISVTKILLKGVEKRKKRN